MHNSRTPVLINNEIAQKIEWLRDKLNSITADRNSSEKLLVSQELDNYIVAFYKTNQDYSHSN